LKAGGNRYQSELYTGALHGFTMSDLPVYNKAASDKHWDRLLDLFEKTLRK
jgi:carboxymethylenebutenolidase